MLRSGRCARPATGASPVVPGVPVRRGWTEEQACGSQQSAPGGAGLEAGAGSPAEAPGAGAGAGPENTAAPGPRCYLAVLG